MTQASVIFYYEDCEYKEKRERVHIIEPFMMKEIGFFLPEGSATSGNDGRWAATSHIPRSIDSLHDA
jgi:hypothetical protein